MTKKGLSFVKSGSILEQIVIKRKNAIKKKK